MFTYRFVGPAILIAAALTLGAALQAADAAYIRKVEEWRATHEADYRRDYVPLAGLFYLQEGRNTAGSGPGHRVVLPAAAPPTIGTFVYERDSVRFEPAANAPVMLKGQPVTTAIELRPAGAEPPDELAIGQIALWVHLDGARRAIRMRDPNGETARSFKGFRWFPIEERFRTTGRFIRDAQPRTVKIAILSGGEQDYTTEGVVEFPLNGRTLRLRPMTTRPGRLFFVFRDSTGGTETYEAARFLYADLNPDGTVVMDFNEAYNPPCAFNPFTTCPLPLPENRLTVPIRAGERDYQK